MPSPKTAETLRSLQALDSEIFANERERRERPKSLESARAELARKKANVDGKKNEVMTWKKEIQKKESDVKGGEDKIAKLSGQLNTAKTNKEYSVLQSEINGVKADNSLIEEEILVLMGRAEVAEQEVKAVQKQVADAEAQILGEGSRIEKELKEIGAKVDSLRKEREKLGKNLEVELLKIYEKIQKAKPDGIAIARVVDGTCQGCYMGLTSQDVNMLMKTSQDAILCRSCNRILYL